MLALAAVLLTPSWVLFSPVVRTLADKAYENSARTPWTGPSSFNLDMVSIRWSLPPNTYSDTALGGGITFALHRDFCARLLPLFPEEAGVIPGQEATFLSCDELRDTVRRGMDTWAINHKNLNFVDVTDRCRDVESVLSCPYAELFIVPETLEISDSSVNDRAAEVRHDLSSVDFYPFSTAGNQLSPGLGVTNTRLVVRAPTSASTFCWYLDSTFCYQFHRWQYADIDVVMIGRIACAAIFGLAFMVVVWVLGQMVNAVCCETMAPKLETADSTDSAIGGISPGGVPVNPTPPMVGGNQTASIVNLNQALATAGVSKRQAGQRMATRLTCGSRRCTNLIEYISVMPTFTLLASLFWLLFAPVFYYRIFMPCWDCYDFEATIAHEIGHVLGFHHPDTEWELNLNAYQPMGPATCADALSHVYLNQTERAIPDSIMFSMTQHQDRTCLSPDDLEGLNYLYPVCNGSFHPLGATGEPLCIKPARLAGWLRLLILLAVPFGLTVLFVLLLQSCVRYQQRKHLVSLEATSARLRAQRALLLSRMREGAKRQTSMTMRNAGERTRSFTVRRTNTPRGGVRHVAGCIADTTSQSTPSNAPSSASGDGSRTARLEAELQQTRARERETSEQLRQLEEIQLRAAINASQAEQPPPPAGPPPVYETPNRRMSGHF